MNKTCNRCKKELEYTSKFFPYRDSNHVRLRPCCKQCETNRKTVWANNNKLKVKLYHRQLSQNIKHQVLIAYGGKCLLCKVSNLDFLSIDHVKNDGNSHRKTIGFGNKIYRWIVKNNYPNNFQILCYNCNWKKYLNSKLGSKPTTKTKYYYFLKNKIYDYYGNKCNCCNFTDKTVCDIDHVDGKGFQHRKEINNARGVDFYLWIIKNNFPNSLQLLCRNCNNGKRMTDNGLCPHKNALA